MIGGTRGGNILYYPILKRIISAALLAQKNSKTISPAQKLKNTALLEPLVKPAPINFYPSSTAPSVNLADNIAKGDESMTPLQFTKNPVADCRVWYMPKDIISVANTWTRVAKGLKAGGKGLCVNGGLNMAGNGNATSAGGANASDTTTAILGGISPPTAFTGAVSLVGTSVGFVALGLSIALVWVL